MNRLKKYLYWIKNVAPKGRRRMALSGDNLRYLDLIKYLKQYHNPKFIKYIYHLLNNIHKGEINVKDIPKHLIDRAKLFITDKHNLFNGLQVYNKETGTYQSLLDPSKHYNIDQPKSEKEITNELMQLLRGFSRKNKNPFPKIEHHIDNENERINPITLKKISKVEGVIPEHIKPIIHDHYKKLQDYVENLKRTIPIGTSMSDTNTGRTLAGWEENLQKRSKENPKGFVFTLYQPAMDKFFENNDYGEDEKKEFSKIFKASHAPNAEDVS